MMRRSALVVGTIGVFACGASSKDTPTCAEQLAPLREELAWADDSLVFPVPPSVRLAAVPQWQRTALPEHVVGVWFDDLVVDGKTVTSLPHADDDDADPERASEHARALQSRVDAALEKPLTGAGSTTVALAVDAGQPWTHVRPVLRTLAERGGGVHLLVGMPAPPWWDTRLFDEVAQGADGMGTIAARLEARAAQVFADCRTAAEIGRSSNMVGYADAIQACDCRVDLAQTREVLHAIATPMIAPVGVVELAVIKHGEGVPFEAEPDSPWSAVLPDLLSLRAPVLLQEPPVPEVVPPPPPPEPAPPSRAITASESGRRTP